MKRYKILLDTDIGDDIDDLLCLQLGLNLADVEFVGITTVFKNTNLRARMVKKVLEINNILGIPVYAGCGDGILHVNDKTTKFCQYDESLNDDKYRPENDYEGCQGDRAIDFILDTVREYGNELIILGIGPFTNIAKAIQKAPEIMAKVGRIVVMGGGFFTHFIEWNVMCDVPAAVIVNECDIRVEYVSADVTHKCFFDEEQYKYVSSFHDGGYKEYLSKLIVIWRESHRATHRCPFLHDPLALMYIVDSSLVTMKGVHAKIETSGSMTRGMTLNYDSCYVYSPKTLAGKENLASCDVKAKEFVDKYIDIVFRK